MCISRINSRQLYNIWGSQHAIPCCLLIYALRDACWMLNNSSLASSSLLLQLSKSSTFQTDWLSVCLSHRMKCLFIICSAFALNDELRANKNRSDFKRELWLQYNGMLRFLFVILSSSGVNSYCSHGSEQFLGSGCSWEFIDSADRRAFYLLFGFLWIERRNFGVHFRIGDAKQKSLKATPTQLCTYDL